MNNIEVTLSIVLIAVIVFFLLFFSYKADKQINASKRRIKQRIVKLEEEVSKLKGRA